MLARKHYKNSGGYKAPKGPIIREGNFYQKLQMFKRCVENKVIPSNGELPKNEVIIEELSKIIPPIILDECIASTKLIEKVREAGYDVVFLGRGPSDNEILEIVKENHAILVTEDREFHERTRLNQLDPCFISKDEKNLMNSVGLIIKHMKKFETLGKNNIEPNF